MEDLRTDAPPPQGTQEAPEAGDELLDSLLGAIPGLNEPAPETEPVVPETPPAKEEAPPAKEEPAPETKPDAEKDDIDAVEPPKNASEAAKDNFNKIKETARGYKDKFVAAETVIETQKTDFETKEKGYLERIQELEALTGGELVELREKRGIMEEAEKELSIHKVESTPEFKRTITEPLKMIEDRLQAIAKANEVSFDDLADAVAELDDTKQSELLNALLPNLSPVDGMKVGRIAEDTRGILTRRTEILSNAAEARKELAARQEKEAAATKEAATKEFKASVSATVKSISERMPFIELAEGETKEGVFAAILAKAEAEDFDKSTPATKGTAAVATVALDRAIRQAQKREEYVKTLEARLAEKNKTAPSIGGDTPKPPAPKDEGDLVTNTQVLLGLQKSRDVISALSDY